MNIQNINYKRLGFFRFKNLGGKFLLTNDVGEFLFLTQKEFDDFLQGKMTKNNTIHMEFAEKGFIKKEVDEKMLAKKYAKKNHFLFSGPSLHIFIVTLRCDNKCLYCHASARSLRKKNMDMTKKIAGKALDKTFRSPNKSIAIEFQGGEPLANWEVIKFIIEQAHRRNKKVKKNLELRLVSNFNLMTQEKFNFLIKNNVFLCTSLDGPRKLHNKNRPMVEGEKSKRDNYKNVVKWIKRSQKLYSDLAKKGRQRKINAVLTTSSFSLKYHKQIINEYVKLGIERISLSPINPFGFSKQDWEKLGYGAKEYLQFYTKALDYILGLNKKGIKIKEDTAVVFLEKILKNHDPNMLEMRSPCGAGIGQLAYHYNGDIYTCDEGRMLSMMGDESFKLGTVETKYKKLIDNSVVKSLCSASCLEGLPKCNDCVYQPYCGTCPIYNWTEQGSIFGHMVTNDRCKINEAILDYIFKKLQNRDTKEIFDSWVST